MEVRRWAVEKSDLLCVENLHLRREDRPILQGVNLKVASGQIYGLLGRKAQASPAWLTP